MNAPALTLVPIDARPEREQLLLRPVLVFARETLKEPWAVVVARRRPAKARCAARAVVLNPYAGDMETYRAPDRKPPRRSPKVRPKRAPIRPGSLQVYAPRSLRPGARPRSLGLTPLTREERAELRRDETWLRAHGVALGPPETLGDCSDEPGPCGRVSCRSNLYLEVDEDTGIVKLNFPDKEVWELAETCAHRVVTKRGALSLEEVGKLLNLTQERVSQIEEGGLAKGKRRMTGRRRG